MSRDIGIEIQEKSRNVSIMMTLSPTVHNVVSYLQ